MEQQNWIEVPEEQQKRWGWLEYSLTVRCICGRDVELYDADLDSSDDRLTCECGRTYSVRLVYREGEWGRKGNA